ncbi:Utp14 protein-domain-containing protein [Camillea tinctor]|nr:Utp14 protein-domain-containing protein [Camillea tinctor]
MPGRQSHGRSLLGAGPSSSKGKGRSRNKASKKKALDAFAIAQEEYGDRLKQNPRNKGLDAEVGGRRGGKHARGDEDDDEEEDEDDDEDGAPPRKMRRGAGGRGRGDEEIEYGSDSSGNEWQIGVPDDDDSEIDSDEAFGESDQEKFDGYAFRGSKKKKDKKQADEDDEDEDGEDEDDDIDDADGASLGSDAIDLADALDMSMSEDDGPEAGREEQGSNFDSDDESGSEESRSGDESSDVDDDEADNVSESGINEWVSQFAGVKDTEEEGTSTTTKPKISLKDLGLMGVKDPQLKKSLKLMNKEEKASKPKKLDVPLARRQQAKIDREAAYEKTKQSLDRWTETVKHNRRADHLVFPLPQNEIGLARHDNTEIAPLNQKAVGTELEQTIMAIIEESGLGPSAEKEKKDTQDDELDGEGLSRTDRKALWQQKRRERELKSREDARAKRIAKIKSKAYHRVHKKQEQREAMKEHEAKVAAGEIDSEEERDAQDRQRAMERMGARHRESKWAKMSNKGGRAAWDESVRMGVTDMARRDEELRRRIEGKSSKARDDDDDDDSDYSGDSEDGDERKRLLRQLNDISKAEDTEPKSKLMRMEFMQKAENAKKKANDELIAQMRRELGSDNDDQSGSDDEPDFVGRKKFGQPSEKKEGSGEKAAKASKQEKSKGDLLEARENFRASSNRSKGLSAPVPQEQNTNPTAGAWSQAATSGPAKKQKGKSSSSAVVLDLGADSVVIAPAAGPVKSLKPSKKPAVSDNDAYSSDEDEGHRPIEFHEQELIERAFGGLDVVGEFEKEKAEIESEDDEKIVDNTLPGWGSWAGEGISNREKNRHKGRFLTKKDGVRKKDRKDAKLKNVIISEKTVKKNTKYMASQLPHQFDSRATYERSLRLPMGPEWLTKESFQDVTKPKVIMKQGIIAPISKPTH